MSVALSIIVPCYNASATIVETLQSALAQRDVPDFEVIVVDDGSTDCSREVLERAGLIDLIHYERQANQGVSVARNTGLDAAVGRFICFLDSDDLLEASFGREMIDLLERRGCRVGYCNYRYFANVGDRPTVAIRYPTYEGDVKGKIISEHFIPTPGAVPIERSAIPNLRFDPRRWCRRLVVLDSVAVGGVDLLQPDHANSHTRPASEHGSAESQDGGGRGGGARRHRPADRGIRRDRQV